MEFLASTSTQQLLLQHTIFSVSTTPLQVTNTVENTGNAQDVGRGRTSLSQKLTHLLDGADIKKLPRSLVTSAELSTTYSVVIVRFLDTTLIIAPI